MHFSYYQYFQLFSLLMAIACYKGLNSFKLTVLIPILVITNLVETLGANYIPLFHSKNNHFIYNIYYLVSTPFYFYLFASMLGGRRMERIRIFTLATAVELFMLVDCCFIQGWDDFNTYSALLVALACIILSCLVLARLAVRIDDETGLLQNPVFWVNALTLLF